MVPFEHTGASVGSGASTTYMSQLRSLDIRDSSQSPPVARDCDGPDAPAPTTTTENTSATPTTTTARDNGNNEVDRPYVPRPPRRDSGDSNGSSGGSGGGDGHPCGPGERDGDGDGLCGES